MLPVSTEFLNQIQSDYRKLHAKVIINYEGPETTSTFTISSDDADPLFDINQTADGVEESDINIAVLDGAWRLGEGYLYSPYTQAGWWTQSVSDSTGAFTTPFPTLVVEILDRTINEIKVVGDTKKNEYPTDFIVNYYDYDGNLIYQHVVTDNDQVKYTYAITINGIYKAELIIQKWSQPHTRAKIVEFMSPISETYEDTDILSIRLSEERELGQTTLPVGNISMNEVQIRLYNDGRFDLDNTSSLLYGRLKPNCKVMPYIGLETSTGTEWIPLGTFWTTEWRVSEAEHTTELIARDTLQRLADSRFNMQVIQDTTLYDILQMILEDAGLNFRQYRIDDAFKEDKVGWAYFDPMSHFQALKLVAGAGLGVVYADRYGIVVAEKIDTEGAQAVQTITADHYYRKETPLLNGAVYTIIHVRTQPLQPDTAQEVYRSLEPVHVEAGADAEVIAFYLEKPVLNATATLENATNTTITETHYYSWGVRLNLHNSGTEAEDVIVVVTGQVLRPIGAELVERKDDKAITDYGKITYTLPNNPLIQDRETAQVIAEKLLASYKDPQRQVNIDWQGNPALQLGDKINIDGQDYLIVKQTTIYDGGLRQRTETRKA